MTRIIEATFDSKALIPDPPLDLKAGQRVIFRSEPQEATVDTRLAKFADWVQPESFSDSGDLPTDDSRQFKHYLYGQPNQP